MSIIFGASSIEAAAKVAYPDALAIVATLREADRQPYIDGMNVNAARILAAAEQAVDRDALFLVAAHAIHEHRAKIYEPSSNSLAVAVIAALFPTGPALEQ